ncbi:MAG: M56 family metallopeptidase [Clostridiales bacterium]|nr:M56 family metallopeptidase [Clostridiales bacterium]
MANLLLQNMLGTSILIVMLLAAYPLLCRYVCPQARYMAWVIVCIGMLIPFGLVSKPLMTISTPQARNPVVIATPAPAIGARLLEITSAPQTTKNTNLEAANPAPMATAQIAGVLGQSQSAPSISFQWPDLYTACLMIWALGAFAAMLFQCIRHIRFFRRVRRWQTPAGEAEQQILLEEMNTLDLKKTVRFMHCVCVNSPMVVGLFGPTLLMPEQELTMEELRLIIRHELTHIKRRDLWGKALMLVCLTVYWFNPLVRAMARAMAGDCEMSCDASVLASTDLSVRKFYGETILGVIGRQRKQQVALSTYFYEGKKDMKNRFASMFDTSRKSKGNAFLAGMAALVLLAGSAFAVTATAPVSDLQDITTPMDTADLSWMEHKTPELFGITDVDNPQYYQSRFVPELAAYSRDLRRGELLRYHDLVYQYELYDLRAEEPVQAAPEGYGGENFAISAPLAEFVSMIPLEARDGNYYGCAALWANVKEAGLMPFLLLPNQEMTDQELLQLIEVVEAFDALVPFFDPDVPASESSNRALTRKEFLRKSVIRELCETDESYRPTGTLSDMPTDGLYILGHNGGGETRYHYPQDREMTDNELLLIEYQNFKIRQTNKAVYENAKDPEQKQLENEVEAKLRTIMGDMNVVVRSTISYTEDRQAWDISFVEDGPILAPHYSYDFQINMDTGELLLASQDHFGLSFISYLVGTMVELPVSAVDPFDPHWAEVAKTYLDKGYFYQGAKVSNVYSDDSVNGFCVKVEYEDGVLAQMLIDPATDALESYKIMTDEMLYGYGVNE